MGERVRRVDHVGILVRSVDESLAYFTDTLGLRLVADEVRSDGTVRLAYLEAGGTTIQLVEPLVAGDGADTLRRRGEGLHHVCFEVDDLRATLGALPGEAAQPIEEGGRNCRVAFLAFRPNGVLVELSQ